MNNFTTLVLRNLILLITIAAFNVSIVAQTESMTGRYGRNSSANPSIILSNCTDEDDNGAISVTARTLNLNESSGVLTGTLSLTVNTDKGSISGNFTMNGTILNSGNPRTINGTMNSTNPLLSLLNGNFNATYMTGGVGLEDTLTITLSGRGATPTGQCNYSGTLIFIGPEHVEVLLNNNIADGVAYTIKADPVPTMPAISPSARVRNVFPNPTSGTEFSWVVNLELPLPDTPSLTDLNGTDNYADPESFSNGLESIESLLPSAPRPPLNFNQDIALSCTRPGSVNNQCFTTGNAPLTMIFRFNGFRGGKLRFEVQAVGLGLNGRTVDTLKIRGLNSSVASINSYIDSKLNSSEYLDKINLYGMNVDDVSDAVKKMTAAESIKRQYCTSSGGAGCNVEDFDGLPVTARDLGFGLLQITNSVNCSRSKILRLDSYCIDTVFNWQRNIDEALKTLFNTLRIGHNLPERFKTGGLASEYRGILTLVNIERDDRTFQRINLENGLPAPKFTSKGTVFTTKTDAGSCGGTHPPVGTPCNQLLDNAVRGYNGYSKEYTVLFPGRNEVRLALFEFLPNFDRMINTEQLGDLSTDPNLWGRTPINARVDRNGTNIGNPGYVQDVSSQNPN